MKDYMLLLAMVLAMTSCTKDTEPSITNQEKMSAEESEIFLKENISIYDARVRSINEDKFVRELYLKNFSEMKWPVTNIGFLGYMFQDNGTGNDIEANDGVFTSIKDFSYNSTKINYSKATISVMKNPIVSPNFKYKKELETFSEEYNLRKDFKAGGTATVTCDFKVVSSGCVADSIWDGFGCIAVSNCSFTIGW